MLCRRIVKKVDHDKFIHTHGLNLNTLELYQMNYLKIYLVIEGCEETFVREIEY